jgi:serine/threonine protein kinase
MIMPLDKLINIAKKTTDEKSSHDIAMDLFEFVLLHLSVISLTAYREAGAKSGNINKEIVRQIACPSMGSWKNFLAMLSGLAPEDFPDGFHDKLFKPLKKKIQVEKIFLTYRLIQKNLEYVQGDDQPNGFIEKPLKCSALEMFDAMVQYRNNVDAHLTQTMDQNLSKHSINLKDGIVSFCMYLKNILKEFPIFFAHTESVGGGEYHRMIPLHDISGVNEFKTVRVDVQEGRLYYTIGSNQDSLVPLFPLILWKDDDFFFMNKSPDYRKTMYKGFLAQHHGNKNSFATDIYEKHLCSFLSPFFGVTSLSLIDLADEKALAHAMQSEWKLPKLKKSMLVGADEKQYKLKRKLGAGGMAEVWEAVSLNERSEVAIKFLLDAKNSARFRREARVLQEAASKTDKIVQFVDFQFDPTPGRVMPFLVMELLPGNTLQDVISTEKSYAFEDVLHWMEDALTGLATLHQMNTVHRDVKPSNLMFDAEGGIKLGDLGIVGAAERSSMVTTIGLTQAGNVMGTYEYMSPEMMAGGKVGDEVAPKADLFSLGAAFYHLLTGDCPYGSRHLAEIATRQERARSSRTDVPRQVIEVRPDCPSQLNKLIKELINIDPDMRPDGDTALKLIQECRKSLKRADANVNANLLGDVEDENVRFDDLMPTWINRYLFFVWPAAIVLQFLVASSMVLRLDLFFVFDAQSFNIASESISRFVPLSKDLSYIGWHLIPLLFVAFLYNVIVNIQEYMKDIYRLDGSKKRKQWLYSAERNKKWARITQSKWTFLVIIVLTLFQCYTTFEKMQSSYQTGVFYWSHYDISYILSLCKIFLVFFNGIGTLFLFLFLVAIMDISYYILRRSELSVDLYDINKKNGLGSVEKIVTLFLPFPIIIATLMSVLTFVEKNQSALHSFQHWLFLTSLSLAYYFFFLWPLYPTRRRIKHHLYNEQIRFSSRRKMIEEKMRNYLESSLSFNQERASTFSSLVKLRDEIQGFERKLLQVHFWPVGRMVFIFVVGLGAIPLILAFTFRLLWL